MIERTYSAEYVNDLVNHPAIRPHVGGDPDAPLDLTAAVNDRQNIFIKGEHGGFAACWTAPRTYEIHTFILPEGRGAWARAFAIEARDSMQEFADHLWTRVHPDAANVRAFTLRAGFKPAGVNTLDMGVGPVEYLLYNWRF